MELREGYKQTEVGVIPEDWEVNSFEQICRVNQGLQIAIERRKKYPTNNSKVYITVQYINSDGDPEYIDDYSNSVCCEPNDVLMTRTGNTGIVVTGETGVFHNNFFKILFNREKINSGFFVYYLRSHDCQKTILEKAGTSTIPDLNHGDFYSIQIALPSFIEQTAIATALSDMDALREGLDQLISKKRDLKQATMQQLLTGKTRLPGFCAGTRLSGDARDGKEPIEGEWEVMRLGDIGFTYGGITGKTKIDFNDGAGKFVTFLNVMMNTIIDCDSFERVRIGKNEIQNRVKQGDLLFNGSSETPEEVALCSLLVADIPDLYLNSFCFGFRIHDNVQISGLFLAYYIRSYEGREIMKTLAQGSTRYNISKSALLNAVITFPKYAEQTAIATILSDMDAEIEALKQRRSKTRDLKQAMMQELLTGKTRLI